MRSDLSRSCFSTGDANQSPVTVFLGRNVSLNCTSQYSVEWDIDESIYIYKENTPEALERGISLGNTVYGGTSMIHRLTVLGSVENNLTSIVCRISGEIQVIASYTISVIGKLEQTRPLFMKYTTCSFMLCGRCSRLTSWCEGLGARLLSSDTEAAVGTTFLPPPPSCHKLHHLLHW